jgi:hypothetical protein
MKEPDNVSPLLMQNNKLGKKNQPSFVVVQLPPSTTSLLANIDKASACQKGRWKTKVEEGEVTIMPVLARKTKEG